MTPLAHGRGGPVAGLEDGERRAALGEVSGGGQTDGSGADDGASASRDGGGHALGVDLAEPGAEPGDHPQQPWPTATAALSGLLNPDA